MDLPLQSASTAATMTNRRRNRRSFSLLSTVFLLASMPPSAQSFTAQPISRIDTLATRQQRLRLQSSAASSSSRPTTQKQPRQNHNHHDNQKRGTGGDRKPDARKLERQIVELGRKGLTDEALAVYHHAMTTDVQHNNSATAVRWVNSAIDACARARPTRIQEAFAIFEQAFSAGTNGRLVPNVFTFGALMSACARARQGTRALALLKSMQSDYHVKPNAVVYSSAIASVARSNPPNPQIALNLLQEATEQHNLVMNVVGYNAAISACAKAGDWKQALHLLTQMEQGEATAKPDHVTYGTVLAALETAEQWQLVLDNAAAAMQQEDLKLSLDVLALTSALKACQQLGLAREALQYLEAMKNTTTKQPYRRKTSGWKRQGVKQPLHGPDAVAYRLAISACARGGAWREGIQLLEEFQQETGSPPDVMAYTAAICGCEYAGEWRRAFGLLDQMRKNGVEPNEVTMAAVIGACGTACAKLSANPGGVAVRRTSEGDATTQGMPLPLHKAMHLLKVLKADDTVVDPNIVVYNAAIRACAEACDMKRALALMKDLRNQGLEPTIVTFGSLMTACERVGSIEGATAVFKMMKDTDIEPNEIIYGAAISCFRKAGESERAFLLLRRMIREGLSPNVATFNTAIVAQVEGRQVEECLERAILIYKIMQSKGRTGARPNRQTYNLLISALAAAKKPREAASLLRSMSKEGFVPDVDMYTAIVTAYERTGQPLRALQLMESMREDGYDFYEIEVLDAAFKKAVKLVNAVGKNWSKKDDDDIVVDDDDQEIPVDT